MSDRGPVGAVVLAAGSSSRLGTPKQLLRYRGESLVRRATLSARGAGCEPVVVVLGAHEELSRPALAGLDILVVTNDGWQSGMASSIRVGVEAAVSRRPDIGGLVLMVCDQLHATAEIIGQLLAAYRTTSVLAIGSTYGRNFGVPALFRRQLFPELLGLTGSGGARDVLRGQGDGAVFLPFPGGEVDIDNPADLALLGEPVNEARVK